MNGRRHLTSSMNEVSRDLIVNSYSKRKQALQDMLPTLTELQRALGGLGKNNGVEVRWKDE
ncbi:hypothetical protein Fmac_003597 [Flemingia macrophylla]|uniref:Vacuolar protein sorting-associated protein 54 N-terminal domain-containing protein n=1 Tax=Flemingia macrophylla TaxID=520843 RepID=A0ABD1N2I6_9FABA